VTNDADNCPFDPNPIDPATSQQPDGDGDGLGDACDQCPGTADQVDAWTAGIPELGIDPQPIQPDSDQDGIPDACDFSFQIAGKPWGSFVDLLSTDGAARMVDVEGGPGIDRIVPIQTCPEDRWVVLAQLPASTLCAGSGPERARHLLDDEGKSVGDQPSPGAVQQRLDFRPIGGADYFMLVMFGPAYPPGEYETFDIALSCDYTQSDPPPSHTPPSTATPAAERTGTPSRTPTASPTHTPTFTPTSTHPPTETSTATDSPLPTASDTPAPTDVPPPTATETPADLSGPVIGASTARPNPNGLPALCRSVPPTVIVAPVSDPAGVQAVSLHVTYRAVEEVMAMSDPDGAGNFVQAGKSHGCQWRRGNLLCRSL
jgi:hypothetical protein